MNQGGKRSKGSDQRAKVDLPLISIVTVTYNAERYLKQALQSIVDQSYSNLELIIIDGGSTDQTLDIIRSFEPFIDVWISEPDKGIYDAMNKGILLATGDFVGFKNADDWYCEGALETLSRNILNDPSVDVWYGNSYSVIQENPIKVSPFFTNHLTLGTNPGIDHRSSFVRLGLHRQMLFDLKYRLAADFDVFWRLKKANAKFAHLQAFIAYKRYGGASDGTKILKETFQINVHHAGVVYALYARSKGWLGFVKWKVGNFVLQLILGKEGFHAFKARKIKKGQGQ